MTLFFLWMLLYPIASSFEWLIASFVHKLRDQEQPETSTESAYAWFQVIIYLLVGFLLFKYQ